MLASRTLCSVPTDLPRHGGLECGTIVQMIRKSPVLRLM